MSSYSPGTRGLASFDVSVSEGDVPKFSSVSQSGRSSNVDSGVSTDIWDRANASDDQDIFIAPTAARIHTIASSDAADDTGSTGANSVTIKYLPGWDTAEASETVTGDLNAGIAMSNAAVFINEMKVNPQATSTSANAGDITATAATDATVSAQINAGNGKTRMAIFAFPSTQTLFLTDYDFSLLKSGGAAGRIDGELLFNPNPNTQTVSFIQLETTGKSSTGTSDGAPLPFTPSFKLAGPGIVKCQASGSAADLDVTAGFSGVLVTT